MKTFSGLPVCALFLFAVFLTGCSSDTTAGNGNSNANTAVNANSSKVNATQDELEDFKEIVKLPFEPEEVVWREEGGNSGNAADAKKKLTAVMRFVPEDSAKIAEHAAAIKAGTPIVIETESWYPAELIAQSQISGDETVKGTTYPANDFIKPPYINGNLTRVETSDYFILELTIY